jgi:transcriptional regulator with PAS, ATPase and Fis domain
VFHKGRVLTVFSARNYSGNYEGVHNDAALLLLTLDLAGNIRVFVKNLRERQVELAPPVEKDNSQYPDTLEEEEEEEEEAEEETQDESKDGVPSDVLNEEEVQDESKDGVPSDVLNVA